MTERERERESSPRRCSGPDALVVSVQRMRLDQAAKKATSVACARAGSAIRGREAPAAARCRQASRGLGSGAMSSSAGERTVRDEWGDDAFARAWTNEGGVSRTNPDRERQLRLLAGMVASRYSEGDLVLSLGCGSGLCSRAVLAQLRGGGAVGGKPRIVGVDASAAMLKMAREIAGPELATFKCTFGALRSLHGADGLMQHAFDDAASGDGELQPSSFLESKLRESMPFASAFSVQALHEAPEDEKLDACRFAHRHLRAGAPFYVLDRFVLDPTSPFMPEYRAMFETSCEAAVVDGVGDDSRREVMGWDEYITKYLDVKLDDATTESAYIEMLREAGFARVEVPYRYFNRSLIVAWKADA